MAKQPIAVLLAALLALVVGCSSGAPATPLPSAVRGATGPRPTAVSNQSSPPSPTSAANPTPTAEVAQPSPPMVELTATVLPLATVTGTPGPTEPVATGAPETDAGARTYESGKSGISFSYPGNWETDVLVDTGGGSAVDQIGLVSPGREALILIQVFQLKQVVEPSDLPAFKEELDTVIEAVARQADGRVLSSQPFRQGSLRGFEYRYTRHRGGREDIIRVFVIVDADRQYNIQLEGDAEAQRRYADTLRGVVSSFDVPSRGGTTTDATAANASTTPGRYRSRENGFAFDYPREWRVVKARTEAEGEEYALLRLSGEKVGISISLNRLRRTIAHPYSPELKAQLDRELSAAVEAYDGELVSSRRFRTGGLRGFEYHLRFKLKGKEYISRQFHFVIEDRHYTVWLETDQAGQKRYADALNQVLSSFDARLGSQVLMARGPE